ncbi:MAG: NAD-dependent epimerase/dehydratase family protein [Lautropia sp.]
MRVLVTGGSGFLGLELVRRLAERGETVIAADTVVSPRLQSLVQAHGNVVAIAVDITDLAGLAMAFRQHRPQAVVHCAAVVGVPASLGSPANVLRVNVQGSLNVLEAMRLYDAARFVHLSSEEVYGDFDTDVVTEEHPLRPLMPYGISKVAVEHFGRTYAQLHGLECVNVRTSWVYGIWLDRPRPPMNYLNAALRDEPLHVEAGADTMIDYTYVDDVVDGLVRVLDHPRHAHDAYHIASGRAISEGDLVDAIRELLPRARIAVGPGRREFVPGVPVPRKGALDCSRAARELGYTPRYDVRAGMAAYVQAWQRRAAGRT